MNTKNPDIIFETPLEYHHIGGYYFHSQLNSTSELFCCLRYSKNTSLSERPQFACVGYYDIKNMKWHQICMTKCFNMQEGAMLQWFNHSEYGECLSFNVISEGIARSAFYSLKNSKIYYLSAPIFSISKDCRLACCLDIHFIKRLRGSYAPACEMNEVHPLYKERGSILILDIYQDKVVDSISASESQRYLMPLSPGVASNAYLVVPQFSDDSKKLAFCLRSSFAKPDAAWPWRTYCVVYSLDKRSLMSASPSFYESRECSHYNWKDNDSIILWTYSRFMLKLLLSPSYWQILFSYPLRIVGVILSYLNLYAIRSACFGESMYSLKLSDSNLLHCKCRGFMSREGHPSVLRDPQLLMYDTYQDKRQRREIGIKSIVSKKDILKFYTFTIHPSSEVRVDCHPRFSTDMRTFSFDTNAKGVRQSCLARIPQQLFHQ